MKTAWKTSSKQYFAGLIAAAVITAALAGGRQISVHAQVKAKPRATVASPVLRFVPEILTVVSGQGETYGEGGLASDALIGEGYGIAVDAAGDIYFADSYWGTIRRIDGATGVITTVAGTAPSSGGEAVIRPETSGLSAQQRAQSRAQAAAQHSRFAPRSVVSAQGVATSTQLEYPFGVALDGSGNVYFSDNVACAVYKVATDGTLTVVAGTVDSCGFGGDGSAATSAKLLNPTGIRVDSAGNLYIADSGNYIIRKVDTNGNIATVAGTPGTTGSNGDMGTAISAQLGYPQDIALDAAGNIFIADAGNDSVRKIDATGIITTIAGNGSPSDSGDGGPATAAGIYQPTGIAVDAGGGIYIAEYSGKAIRKIDASGTIRTIAGLGGGNRFSGADEAATDAHIGSVNSVAVDAAGNVYATLDNYNYIAKIGPSALLDFGTVFLSTPTYPQTLTLMNEGSTALTFSGAPTFDDGTQFSFAPAASGGCNFSQPLAPGASCDLTVTFTPKSADSFTATLSFADNATNSPQTVMVRGRALAPPVTVTLQGSSSDILAGQSVTLTATVAPLHPGGPIPTGTVELDGTNATVTGTLDANGVVSFTFPSLPPGYYEYFAGYEGDSNYSFGASQEFDVYVEPAVASVTLSATPTLVKAGGTIQATATITGTGAVAPTGSIAFVMGGTTVATAPISGGTASASFSPARIGNAGVQAVYFGDGTYEKAYSNTQTVTAHAGILQFTPAQTTLFAGVPTDDNHGGSGGDGGPAKQAYMHFPAGVAVDSVGNVYIADESNDEIRKVDAATGVISQYAGVPHTQTIYSCYYSGDGSDATNAYFCNPTGLAFDSHDNLYISDYSNNVIRRVDAVTHVITRFAGVQGQTGYNGDQAATASTLSHPQALTFDSAGNLYIADTGNKLVRKVDTAGNLTTVAGRYGYNPTTPTNNTPATTNTLNQPTGIAVDSLGNFYVADDGFQTVFKVDTAGNLTTYAGGGTSYSGTFGDGGPATNATLSFPEGLAFDAADNLFIADNTHGTVRRVDKTTGIITAYAGIEGVSQGAYNTDPSGKPSTNISILFPYGIAFDNRGGLYVTDDDVNVVLKFGPDGNMMFPATGGAPQLLTLTNAGDTSMTFGTTPYSTTGNVSVSAAPANSCNFAASLAAGATCNVSVSLPTGGTGTISFSDDGVSSPQTVTVGVNPNPATSTTQLVIYGSPAAQGAEMDLLGEVTGNGLPPGGTISFYEGTTLLGSAAITQGIAYIPITTLSPGDHNITAVYSGDLNYNGSTSDVQVATVTSTLQSQTIMLGTLPSPTYADTSFSVGATASSGLSVTITVLSGPAAGSGTFAITDAGTVMLQATQAGDATYQAAPPINFSVTVAPVALTVTASSAARIFDQPNPPLTYAITGFARGENSGALSGTAMVSTTAIGTSPPGTYPVTVAQGTLASTNYTVTFVNGTLTVNGQANQTITFGRIPNLPVGMAMNLTARASSGLPVTYSVTGPAILAGNKLTPNAHGLVTVTASQAGNANYAAATSVSQSFTAQ